MMSSRLSETARRTDPPGLGVWVLTGTERWDMAFFRRWVGRRFSMDPSCKQDSIGRFVFEPIT